jgi:hypothetical protein
VRDNARVRPLGLATKTAAARRVTAPPWTRRLIVSAAVAASPVNRLLTLTPPSTSRPRPVVKVSSMTAASAGRLATITRSLARSYQRNAGIPSITPCRIPSWLAGVVAGSFGVHSARSYAPDRIQRDRVGTVPAVTAIWTTGKGTPSICTNTTPGISESVRATGRRLAPDTNRATRASSVPAVLNQPTSAPTMPMIQAARNADQNPSTWASGSRFAVTATMSA